MSIAALRQAAPYIRLYRGQTFVVKVGGEAVAKPKDRIALLEQISVLSGFGVQVVLVHGGGPQATELATRLGLETVFVDGRRVTDEAMVEAMTMASGKVRSEILASGSHISLPCVGLSGIDAGLMAVHKRKGSEVDYGFVGDIDEVNPKSIQNALAGGFLPVITSLCVDSEGQILNVNADTFASRIAVALGAAKLILVTSARGVLRDVQDPGSLISVMDLKELSDLGRSEAIKDGMLPKASAVTYALEHGVERVHIVSYQFEDALLTEVFTNEGCGTMIVRSHDES